MLRAPKRLHNLIERDFKRTLLKKFIEKVEPKVEAAIQDKKSEGGDEWRRSVTPMLRVSMQNALRGYHPDRDANFDGREELSADKLSTLIDLGILIADADDAYWKMFTYAWNEVQSSEIELESGNVYLSDEESQSMVTKEVRRIKTGREPDVEWLRKMDPNYDWNEDELKDEYE